MDPRTDPRSSLTQAAQAAVLAARDAYEAAEKNLLLARRALDAAEQNLAVASLLIRDGLVQPEEKK